MLMVIKFDVGADIIDVPQSVIENADEYQKKFSEWLFDKNADHSYWRYENGKKFGCNYRSDALVEWLNAFPLSDSEEIAKIVAVHVNEFDKTLPYLFF